MTRKEEIHNAAMDVSNRWKRSELLPTQDEIIAYDAAVTMAEWADENPKKGLWDAQKVIEWLNSVDFSKYVENLSVVYVGQLKDDLIKAMEN